MWAFLCDEPAPIITYRFSPSRSGDTPAEVLGGSTGALVVDMYTGYNQITSTGGRTRVACLAHARRHLCSPTAGVRAQPDPTQWLLPPISDAAQEVPLAS